MLYRVWIVKTASHQVDEHITRQHAGLAADHVLSRDQAWGIVYGTHVNPLLDQSYGQVVVFHEAGNSADTSSAFALVQHFDRMLPDHVIYSNGIQPPDDFRPFYRR